MPRFILLSIIMAFALPAYAETEPMTRVIDERRLADRDLVFLRNGERLTGTFLNEAIHLRAAYGSVEIGLDWMAGIDFREAFRGVETVWTVNYNRLSGFLEEAHFRFQADEGALEEIRKEEILKVVLRRKEREPEIAEGSVFLLLQNGDCLSGALNSDLSLLEAGGKVLDAPLNEVQFVVNFSPGQTGSTVWFHDGRTETGALTFEDWDIRLTIGSSIRIYRDRVHILYAGAEVPPFARDEPMAFNPGGSAGVSGLPRQTPGARRKDFVWLPPGEVSLGSPTEEEGRDDDEGPQTEVELTEGLWMCRYEVTQSEYRAVMGVNPSNFAGDSNRPVDRVSWWEANAYCTRRTDLEQKAGLLPQGYEYRLPTEAEWEYACRAGSRTRFSYGDDPDYQQLEEYAWHTANADSTTHPVGEKKSNAWGLHDMHGNVWEWCLDRWQGYYPGGRAVDYQGPVDGSTRAARGGSWLYGGAFCRSANRDNYGASNRLSDVGFRVVIAPAEGKANGKEN